MSIKRYLLAVSILPFFFLWGCSTASKNSIPPNVNNVYIVNFKNDTNEPGLTNLLMDEATNQLLADGSINLVESREKADVFVKGTITDYKQIPLVFNDQDIVQLYKIRIEMSLRMVDPENGEVLKEFEDIFRETRYSDVNPPVETELVAQERVIRKLARDVVTTIVEGWPYLKL